uniref:RING-type domain-containing protein n=1 Tax=Oryza punctata TaxID=4537 RepID=A0A0E0L3T2_ORYPU
MPFSLLLFTGAVAGVSMLVLPWCAVGEDDDSYIDVVDDSYDSDAWYTDYSDDDEGGDNEDGLTPRELQMLPCFAYCGGGGDRCCGICLEEMRDGEKCRRPGRCRHAFHAACVDEWLTTRRTCPCCRELVLVPPAAAG